ncbi:MAG: hypothetical protein OXC03_07185 [Flavobacteriaceae bacterium]|nr:hypothetical protein [Flavobacteriaceae bacterium]
MKSKLRKSSQIKLWVDKMTPIINKIDQVFLTYGDPYDHVDFSMLSHQDRHDFLWWDEFFKRYLDTKSKIVKYQSKAKVSFDISLRPDAYEDFVVDSIKKFFLENRDLQIRKKFNKIKPYVHRDFGG